jgi:ubiquinol-cytochrome c reductase iron-sulfur subunit
VRALLAFFAVLAGAVRGLLRREPPPDRPVGEPEHDPREMEVGADPRAELAVAALLVVGGALALAFAVLIAAYPQTQLLGGTLAAGLVCIGVALAIASRRVVPRETDVEERHPVPEEVDEELAKELQSVGAGISRRRLLTGAAGVAGAGLAGAFVLPLTALGPNLDDQPNRSPWRRGRRLVDPQGQPLKAADIGIGSMQSALPASDPTALEELTAPIVVVRVDPATLDLPADRRTWAPNGILAFSQICTHAACAITLFRYPVDEQTSKPPGLVCPCHYSTFDVRRGAVPVFGPAVRPLPQLPLAVDEQGFLVANGPLSGSVGPSYLNVKRPNDVK